MPEKVFSIVVHYFLLSLIKRVSQGQPCGIVVKFMHSALAAQGSWVQILGVDLSTTHQAMLWQRTTYKIEEDGPQMLAQEQSSSSQKWRIGNRH